MPETTVIAGSSPVGLAERLAERLGASLVTSNIRTFPDGESKITLAGTPAGRCIVVQSTHPPVDTNLIRALSLVHKAAERASGVTAVVPYMGYGRQDKEFLPGEVITLKAVAQLFRGAGADRVVTVDVHSMLGLSYFGETVKNVSAVPELAGYFGSMSLDNPLVVSPDRGGRERAGEFARILGTECLVLEKERDRKTGEVTVQSREADVGDRDAILVDDMISTGGSMVKAAEFLKTRGCRRVFAACTHALLVDGAAEKMGRAGVVRIVGANTIPGEAAEVDVSGIVAGALA